MYSLILQYFKDHGLTEQSARDFGLSWGSHEISIPVFDLDGKLLFKKHRHFDKLMKYTYDAGAKSVLYGIHRLPKDITAPRVKIYITEGEFDAMAVWGRGKLAVSTTGGASTWKDEWNEYVSPARGFTPVIVYDRDDAGAQGTYRVWSSLQASGINPEIAVVPLGCGKDISEYIANKENHKDKTLHSFTLPKKAPPDAKKGEKIKALRSILETINGYLKHPEVTKNSGYILTLFHRNLYEEYKFLNRKHEKRINGRELSDLKKIPITNFVYFRNGLAKCVFHQDQNPSMVYNDEKTQFPNTVKCYSCGKFGSVIDVIMAQKNMKFKEAVEFLKANS